MIPLRKKMVLGKLIFTNSNLPFIVGAVEWSEVGEANESDSNHV